MTDRAGAHVGPDPAWSTRPLVPFAGVRPGEVECFIERVPAREAAAAIDRWRELQREGWDIEALTYDDGGQVTELVGLGCRYPTALRATA